MSQITFGGQPCLDPVRIADDLREQQARGLWVDLSFIGKANGYRCPLGQEVGRGWVLLSRDSLESIDIDKPQSLVFNVDSTEITGVPSATQNVTLQNLLFLRATCLAPGINFDKTTPYLCELVDLRHLAKASVIDKAYNLRASPAASPGCYLGATLNSGAPWTWDAMVHDIWNEVGSQIGDYPGLPFTPDGTPEGFNFYGSNAWDALGMVLTRLTFAFGLNPITNVKSIVNVGQIDLAAGAALQAVDNQRMWDSQFLESVTGRLPTYCRVLFSVQRPTPDSDGNSPFYYIDVTDVTKETDTDIGGDLLGQDNQDPLGVGIPTLSTEGDAAFLQIETTVPNTYAIVQDDMAAVYDSVGVLTNDSALTARANSRAIDYFVMAKQARLLRTFIGPRGDLGLLPGPQVRATTWRDIGGGMITDVEAQPYTEGWPFTPDNPSLLLTKRVMTDGTLSVQPTGEGDAETLILSGGSEIAFLRLTGLPGQDCPDLYFDGYKQGVHFDQPDLPSGSGSGSGSGGDCAGAFDQEEVDVYDFNAIPGLLGGL